MKQRWMYSLAVLLLALALLTGCSGGKAASVKDGKIELEGALLDFGSNTVPNSSKASLSILKPEGDGPDGLSSALYELNLDLTCEEPVTIRIPLTGAGKPEQEDLTPMLGLGTEITLRDGTTKTLYAYIPGELTDTAVTATFIPAEYLEQLSVRGSSGGATPSREKMRLGIFWCSTTFTDGGHFIVYFPAKSGSFFLNYNDRAALLTDLEAVYNDYLAKNYVYSKRSDWPMEVNIQSLDALGYYSYGWSGANGKIYLDRKLFEKGYAPGSVTPLLAHEFFHFVQLNYVDPGDDNLWFDEATATYFEGEKSGSIPSIVAEYNEKIFSGVIPEENDAANGYARMPLIQYLAKQKGQGFILSAYQAASGGTDWDSAITGAAGPVADWAANFYEALVKGEVGSYAPYTLHSNLAAGERPEVGTALELKMPTPDEMATIVENDEIPLLGETAVSIAPYGAQLVALTMDSTNLFRVQKGTDPVVTVSGGDLRVFAVRGGKHTVLTGAGGSVKLSDFKELSEDKHVFLALITGLHSSGKQDYTLKVELQPYPTLDELVGEYPDGMMTFADVYVSPELKADPSSVDITESDSEDDLGCEIDFDIIANLEKLKGKSEGRVLQIFKTGEDTGTLVLIDADGEPSDPLKFTYLNGVMIFEQAIEGLALTGDIAASYGKNQDVVIDGFLTIKTRNSDDLKIDLAIKGTKPLVTP